MKSRTFVVAALAGLIAVASIAADDAAKSKAAAKRADIKRMMEVTGAGELGIQAMNQMIAAFQQSNAGVPDKFWKEFMAEVDANELVEMVIPIYEKYLTHDDIRGLIKFYETPLGTKLIEVQPKIMLESMTAGQKWGQQIGEKVTKKLKEQGYK